MIQKWKTDEFYDENTRKSDSRNFYVLYVLRPISFALARFFSYLSITANQIMLFRALLGIVLSTIIFINVNQSHYFIIYAFTYHFIVILDYVDGNLARYFKSKNFIGKMFDGWLDTILESLFYISVGFSLGLENYKWSLFVYLIYMISVWTKARFQYVNQIKTLLSQKIDKGTIGNMNQSLRLNFFKKLYTQFENIKLWYFTIFLLACALLDIINDWHYFGGLYIILLSMTDISLVIFRSIRSFNVKY